MVGEDLFALLWDAIALLVRHFFEILGILFTVAFLGAVVGIIYVIVVVAGRVSPR